MKGLNVVNFSNVLGGLSRVTGKSGLVFQAKKPEILLVVGVTGVVASTVMACRATLKVDDILTQHNQTKGKIDYAWTKVQEGEIPLDDYSERDRNKDIAIVYTQTAVSLVKLYAPSIVLGTVSLACIISGHKILKSRNVALMAAYKMVDEGFTAYRNRVIEEHGEQVDYMYKHGLRNVETTNPAYTDEEGIKHKATKVVQTVGDPNGTSVYARFFDDSSDQWSKVPEYNMMFLRAQQNYYNDMLRSRGHVFLNEVYDALGLKRTEAGAIVGWVISEHGDNYIDFGVFDGERVRARDFVNGYENSILLDFNVDGVIYDVFTK